MDRTTFIVSAVLTVMVFGAAAFSCRDNDFESAGRKQPTVVSPGQDGEVPNQDAAASNEETAPADDAASDEGEAPVDLPPNQAAGEVKVAFIGDSGLGADAELVLQLIKDEGAMAVVHAGDLDYDQNAAAFEGQITKVLGDSFPYMVAAGNHDSGAWPDYQASFAARNAKNPDISCEGDYGVNSVCMYKGILVLLTAPDELGANHDQYIRTEMAKSNAKWKVCSWHKNMETMQVGGKSDSTGWAVYEACREAGAITATGHEHSYSRTHLLSSMQNKTIVSTSSDLVIEPGQSIAFVSGLGGQGVREQVLDGPWWASIYTSNQNAAVGALFCTFNVGGQQDKASCYFKDVNGNMPDKFTMTSKL